MNEEEAEIYLCIFLIYYKIALYEGEYVSNMMYILGQSRTELRGFLENMPENHPSVEAFQKLEDLNDEQYYDIANKLKIKIEKFNNQSNNNIFDTICNRELVDISARIIVYSSEYNSLEEYIEEKLKNKDPQILYFMGMTLSYTDEEEGMKLVEESANLNYEYAIYELSLYYYNNQNLALAEHNLLGLLDSKDKNLLSLVQNLLGRIYYYGGNKVKKDTEKALEFLLMSNENGGYERPQNYNYIKKIVNDKNNDRKERDVMLNIGIINTDEWHNSNDRDAQKSN